MSKQADVTLSRRAEGVGWVWAPFLSCPVLEVAWQLTSGQAARPHLDVSACFSLVHTSSEYTPHPNFQAQGKEILETLKM